MNVRFRRLAVPAMLLFCAGAADAVTVAIAPAGNATFAGNASFKVTSVYGTEYTGSCTMSMQVNFNASNASFVVNSVSLGYPCGQKGGWNVSTPSLSTPWYGTTTAVGPTNWRSTITDADIVFLQDGSPWWAALFTASVPFTVKWLTGSLNGPSTGTGITTNGFQQFANGMQSQRCHLSFVLYLSPFQTLTNIP